MCEDALYFAIHGVTEFISKAHPLNLAINYIHFYSEETSCKKDLKGLPDRNDGVTSVDITSGMDWGHKHANYAQMLWHNLWHI